MQYTGWTFFHINLLLNCIDVCLKRTENKQKNRPFYFLINKTIILFYFRRPTKRCFLLRLAGQPVLLLPLHGPHLRAEGPVHQAARARPAREGGRREGERRAGAEIQRHPERKRGSSEENSGGQLEHICRKFPAS